MPDSGYSALVVDDSKLTRLIICRELAALGFTITQAEHGRRALEILQSNGRFDLALIDWNMPELDGPGLIQEMRRRPDLVGTKLLLSSATEETAEHEKAIHLGSDEFLFKPFTRDELAAKLREMGFDL
jgi:two-component system chemotaxis response regulator CheY